jgi:serine/threonine-protein kinase
MTDDLDRTKVSIVDPLIGSRVGGRYEVTHQLAAGGFGAVYRASDIIDHRDIALKVLRGQLATDPAVVARFRREAATLARLHDPHTVAAYDHGQTRDGTLYIAMELLEGESLYERYTSRGPLPWRRVVAIARAVCSSLAEAHALGIIHRDLKPANIHLERRGDDPEFVKVLDFGIAKLVDPGTHDAELTHAGQMIGTFDYMAPEQMVGAPCTGQCDIFTLGIVIYEMIAGRRPFGEPETASQMLAAILGTTPQPLSISLPTPPALDAVVARCLQRDPLQRFADVGELAAALDELLAVEDDPTKTRVAAAVTAVMPAAGEDATWIDQVPPVQLKTTLPGIVPPGQQAKWPLIDPTRKRR